MAQRILVVQPSWVGDAVMATPTLRAIHELYPQAEISYLLRRYVKPLYAGMPWADRLITYRAGKTGHHAGTSVFKLAARLRRRKFDLAVLLPNSFKAALICKLAGIPRIVGYEKDGRGILLSDLLQEVREEGRRVPSPIIQAYMELARALGSTSADLSMKLFVTERERIAAERILSGCGLNAAIHRPGAAGASPLILLNPGANYGAAKCWPTKYFAELADRLISERHATILISAAPKERQIVREIQQQMKQSAIDLSATDIDLGSLKEIVRRCDLMITNDTGPRHIAAAMQVAVVTLFGPTFPEWTEIYYKRERQLAIKVFCGPCQRKVCPLDHRCMTELTPSMAYAAAVELLNGSVPLPIVK